MRHAAICLLALACTKAAPPVPDAAIELVEAAPAPDAAERAFALPEGETFGGQALAWWQGELSAKTSSASRRALLELRARRNGLRVGDEVSAPPALARARANLKFQDPPERVSSSTITVAIGPPMPAKIDPREDERPRTAFAPRSTGWGALRVVFPLPPREVPEEAALDRLALFALLHSSSRPEAANLRADVRDVGGRLEVEHNAAFATVELEAPAPEFDALARRTLSAFVRGAVSGARLETAKQAAMETDGGDDVSAIASLVAGIVLDRSAFSGGKHGAEQLAHLDVYDVNERVQKLYSPANASIAIAGEHDEAKLRAHVRGLKGGREVTIARYGSDLAGSYRLRSDRQTHVVAFPFEATTVTDVAVAELLSTLLDSKLFHAFRDRGEAYVVISSVHHYGWQDVIMLAVPFGETAALDTAPRLEREIEALVSSELDDAALRHAKRAVLARLSALDRSPIALARRLAAPSTLTDPSEIALAAAKVDRALLQRRASEWLSRRAAIHIGFGPTGGEPKRESPKPSPSRRGRR